MLCVLFFLFDIGASFVYTFILRRGVLMIIRKSASKGVAILLFMIMIFMSVLSVSAEEQPIKSYGAFNYRVSGESVYINKYTGDMTEVFIPGTIDGMSVVGIDEEAFWYKDKITAVKLPESLLKIGDRAFQGCSSIEEIVLPDSVAEIGDAAFENCKKLKSINVPADLAYVGAFAYDGTPWIEKFYDNTSIIIGGRVFYKYLGDAQKVVIPKGVLSISANAFEGKKTLTYVSIPDTVVTVGGLAFYNCESLKSVSLPSSIYKIGERAFGYYVDNALKDDHMKYEDFTVYADEKNEDGEYLAAAVYCQNCEINLEPLSKYATPDELPAEEICVVKDIDDSDKGAQNNTVWITVVIIAVSCVVVIGGIYIISSVYEKKRKKSIKTNRKNKK